MWSRTSSRAKRISDPKRFRSSPKKEFFNTIRQKRPLHSAGHSIFRDRFKLTGVSEDPESRYYPSQVRDFFREPVQSREGDGENPL
jgi:hypothetical protein